MSAATYRVRGYVSALVERDKTTFAWVWDVYDTDKRRALRLSGEEPAAAIRPAPGTARLAAARLDRRRRAGAPPHGAGAAWNRWQASSIGSEQPPAAAPPPEPSLVTLVSRRDDLPEGAGIFRLFGGPSEPAPAARSRRRPASRRPRRPPNWTSLPSSTKPAKTRNARSAAVAATTTDGRSPRP